MNNTISDSAVALFRAVSNRDTVDLKRSRPIAGSGNSNDSSHHSHYGNIDGGGEINTLPTPQPTTQPQYSVERAERVELSVQSMDTEGAFDITTRAQGVLEHGEERGYEQVSAIIEDDGEYGYEQALTRGSTGAETDMPHDNLKIYGVANADMTSDAEDALSSAYSESSNRNMIGRHDRNRGPETETTHQSYQSQRSHQSYQSHQSHQSHHSRQSRQSQQPHQAHKSHKFNRTRRRSQSGRQPSHSYHSDGSEQQPSCINDRSAPPLGRASSHQSIRSDASHTSGTYSGVVGSEKSIESRHAPYKKDISYRKSTKSGESNKHRSPRMYTHDPVGRGHEYRNSIPRSIDIPPDALEGEKIVMLNELYSLRSQNPTLIHSVRSSERSNYEEIQVELYQARASIDCLQGREMMKDGLRISTTAVEYGVPKITRNYLSIEGWSDEVSSDLKNGRFDAVLTAIYRQYWRSSAGSGLNNPMVQLAFMLIGSAGVYAVKTKMGSVTKNTAPQNTTDHGDDSTESIGPQEKRRTMRKPRSIPGTTSTIPTTAPPPRASNDSRNDPPSAVRLPPIGDGATFDVAQLMGALSSIQPILPLMAQMIPNGRP